jgi:hypothetical protein
MWVFMAVLEHDREEELFIANALIELFNHVKENLKNVPMTWSEITNMIIELMNENDLAHVGNGGFATSKLTVKAEAKIRHPRAPI